MSTPDSDNPKVDSDRMFDFLDEEAVGRSVRAKQARQSAEFVMPIIRKPVPVSESGPAQVGSSSFAVISTDTVEAPEGSELPVDDLASDNLAGDKFGGDDFAGDDFEFLDATSARRTLPVERQTVAPQSRAPSTNPNEAWNAGIHVDDGSARSPGSSKRVGLLLGIILVSGGSIAYMLFGGSTSTSTGPTSVASDEQGLSSSVTEPVDQASNGASLYQRFTQRLETLQALVASGELDDADNMLSTMDRAVYGYGAAEFSQIELEIDRLRSGAGETETVAEATEAAEVARAEQAEQLAEAARVEAANAQAAQLEATQQAEAARQVELERLAEQERLAEEARVAEVARQAEETRLADAARQAEAARLVEQERLAEAARQEEANRLAEQTRLEQEAEAARLAEVARQAEEQRLADAAREAEAARLAEVARQAEEARLAEVARAEQARVAQVAQQAEAARQESARAAAARRAQAANAAEQARVAEEARLAAERERVANAGREAARAAQALVAAERARNSLDQETLALGTEIAQERIDSARAQEIRQQRRLAERARLSRESAESAEFARQQAAERQRALDAQANLEITPIRSSSGISDEDFNYVANQFVQLKNAITERNIEKVASLTRTSGSRTQQLLQVFQNHSEIKARISSVNAVDSDGRIVGKLLIQKLVRNSGVEVSVPSNLSSIELTSTRGPSGWSDIIW